MSMGWTSPVLPQLRGAGSPLPNQLTPQEESWVGSLLVLGGLFAESSNLSNIEHRAVIKYFVKKGKTPKEIFEDMVSVLQESAFVYDGQKNGLAYFNKDERAVKMILAQGVL
ncbi:hypothetical protein EVAR_3613_1 [Eumeta japonica]|uniref:Uncharacterized protein n=1 Tax=Eumeta variegata TaxID=151549 RepID=A0A4C1SYD8_EUMVA|nr:hypothetical protein EVAR_3613_1 [Eumeta japonica]